MAICKNKYAACRTAALFLAAVLTAFPLSAPVQVMAETADSPKTAAAEKEDNKENKKKEDTGEDTAKADNNEADSNEADNKNKSEDTAKAEAEKTEAVSEEEAKENTAAQEITTEGTGAEEAAAEAARDAADKTTVSPYDSPLEFKHLYTKDGIEDLPAERAANKAQPPQTNTDPAWPQGPSIGAAGAVVMDADSGEVLYAKNMYMHLYPASITKVMTGLLACENLKPTDRVTFSENAVFGIERGSSNIGMDVDESITVEEAVYGLMVASANEVAVALGERVSGSETAFINLMNLRAEELGCRNTNFVTTNGLHDPNHYTCAYDMALIAREAFRHPELIEYMSRPNYHFEASEKQPDEFWIGNTNSFLNGEISCDDVIGGKTGYTDEARETLVSFAERDGKRLICVIMREEPPYQYYDTIDLLEYAYDNFYQVSISGEENRFTMQGSPFLSSGIDIFGNSMPGFTIEKDAALLLPKNVPFSDLSASISPFTYEGSGEAAAGQSSKEAAGADSSAEGAAKTTEDQTGTPSDQNRNTGREKDSAHTTADGIRILGEIQYKYHDYSLGTVNVLFTPGAVTAEETSMTDRSETAGTAGTAETAGTDLPVESSRAAGGYVVPEEVHGIRALFFALVHTGAHGSVYLNILLFLPLLMAAAFLLCVFFWIRSYFVELNRYRRLKKRRAARAQQPQQQRSSGNQSSGRRTSGTTTAAGNRGRTRGETGTRTGTETGTRTGAENGTRRRRRPE